MEISLVPATHSDIPDIIRIAEKTWWTTYSTIISNEQIHYMLSVLFNEETLSHAITDNTQSFLLVKENQQLVAFASYGRRSEDLSVVKIFKLYVLPHTQGRGYGRLLIEEIINSIKNEGVKMLELNVNRHNKAKLFYERVGFKCVREEDIPIGPYWMNDYVMQLALI